MNIAKEISTASNCISKQVGAVLVKDGRIISTGYNGTPKGYVNCCDYMINKERDTHHEWSLKYEIHAEMNAIIFAAREGISILGSTLYCTMEPCSECTKNIIASGIKEIYYSTSYEYSNTPELNEFLSNTNVIKIKLEE
jgi:dCMP deaminase